jgi:hypothetical protein
MRLETPTRIRDLQRGLYLKAKREYALVCHEVKMIGKPSAGRSSRQDCNPTGESPAVTVARVGHVAMPHPE